MPIYETILGARASMSTGRRMSKRIAKQLERVGADDASAGDNLAVLQELAASEPALRIELAIESESAGFELRRVANGRVESIELEEALAPDGGTAAERKRLSRLRESLVTLAIAVDADRLVRHCGEEGTIDVAGERTIEIGGWFSSHEAMIETLALVAAVMKKATAEVVGDVDGTRYLVTLDRDKGARARPLYLFATDGTADDVTLFYELSKIPPHPPRPRARRLSAFRKVAVPTELSRKISTTKRDEDRPLTTGSLRQRKSSLLRIRGRDPALVPVLIAALRDDANAGPDFADIRVGLYQTIAWQDRDDVFETLVEGLRNEPDDVVERILAVFWRLETREDALEAMLASEKDKRFKSRIERALQAVRNG